MFRFSALSQFLWNRRRAGFFLSLAAAALLLTATAARAQFGGQAATPVHDATALHPPAGARVAIVEFDDMECPDCAAANPVLKAAAEKYHSPWIRHDFPLPFHNWSFQAAVNARWFDTKSKDLGNQYRDAVFANQISIETRPNLLQFTQKFAQSHGIALPFAIDPQGKLTAEVKADYALGQRIGIEHTPTIWIVTSGSKGAPYIEVISWRTQLYQIIDRAIADTRSAAPASGRRVAHK
ncbi:MAG: thioredoxin domain-containing protein [Acidobacteriota bacterium]|nr:thioredoxin domain-containing protein [Acidobacteriota bacterium]